MIVNYKETGWEIITQRAHGLVAAQVAIHWQIVDQPSRWTETLLVIGEHDDAEVELDGEDLITMTGGPINFQMKKFDREHCERMAMLSISKSRYIALLTSMHMVFLHQKEESENKEVREFLTVQREKQASWKKQLGIDDKEAKRIYSFLEWCDAFSLLICQRQLQPEKRAVEISTGPDGVIYHLTELEEGVLTVEPWPFDKENFDIFFESREISQLKFESSAEFRQAFVNAEVKENRFEIMRTKTKVSKPKKV